jgi:uncharacterized protein YecT (DUF1311 family)
MTAIRPRFRSLLAASIVAASAFAQGALAGALEECKGTGDSASLTRCLSEEERKANTELSSAEAAAAQKARTLDGATGRTNSHAALAKSVREFSQYRLAHCGYVKEAYGGTGTTAEQAQMGCIVDMTRRRVRELRP